MIKKFDEFTNEAFHVKFDADGKPIQPKIKEKKKLVSLDQISFKSGSGNDAGYGSGNGSPKISGIIPGLADREKAFFRNENWYGSDNKIQVVMFKMVADFLNTPEAKKHIAEAMIENNYEVDIPELRGLKLSKDLDI